MTTSDELVPWDDESTLSIEELARRQGVTRVASVAELAPARPVRVRRRVRGVPRRPVRLPAGRPRVTAVVVDTDVASAILKGRLDS